MARITITDTDTHVADTDAGQVVFTFKILSHERFTSYLGQPMHEMLREVLLNVAGLELEQAGEVLKPEAIKAAVFTLLTQCSACFVTDNGTLTGFRYQDAQQIAHWQQLNVAACQRLPLAVNAILQGKG